MQLETCLPRWSCLRAWQSGIGRSMNDRARSCSRRGPRRCTRRGTAGDLASARERPGHSALDLARALHQSFHSLRKLIAADRQRFCAERGLGLARFAELQAAVEIARRQLSEHPAGPAPRLASPDGQTGLSLLAAARSRAQKCFAASTSTSAIALTSIPGMFRGTIDGASVHPREIVKLALQRNSAAVIIAHNHPPASLNRARADELITQRVKEALALVDIRLLDHIIIGGRRERVAGGTRACLRQGMPSREVSSGAPSPRLSLTPRLFSPSTPLINPLNLFD